MFTYTIIQNDNISTSNDSQTPFSQSISEELLNLNELVKSACKPLIHPINIICKEEDITENTLKIILPNHVADILVNSTDIVKSFVNKHFSLNTDITEITCIDDMIEAISSGNESCIFAVPINCINTSFIRKLESISTCFEKIQLIKPHIDNPVNNIIYILTLNRNSKSLPASEISYISPNTANIVDFLMCVIYRAYYVINLVKSFPFNNDIDPDTVSKVVSFKEYALYLAYLRILYEDIQ